MITKYMNVYKFILLHSLSLCEQGHAWLARISSRFEGHREDRVQLKFAKLGSEGISLHSKSKLYARVQLKAFVSVAINFRLQ